MNDDRAQNRRIVHDEIFVLDYNASTSAPDDSRLRRTCKWRKAAGWAWWATLLTLPLGTAEITLALAAIFLVFAGMSLYHMFRVAAAAVGRGYAARQLAVALLLMPALGVGVFLVTRLVRSDLLNWQLSEERADEK
jgi:hypothetical protein